jgi:peptidoglycan/xylan/chitin deacetylase (PgdA/CDA1 family)
MWKHLVSVLVMLAGLVAGSAARAAESAVVLLYHRFGDERAPASNTRLDQLEAHLAELKSGGYTVLPLPEILAAFRDGRPLPDKAVAITIDDAAASVYSRAWPRLKQAGLPVTLFVTTDEADRGGEAMNWTQIRQLAEAGVTIGTMGAQRLHMAKAGREQVVADLARARARFEKELGRAPDLLAWPYGEASAEAMAVAADAGFVAAVGQQSGVAHAKAGAFFLPRFAMSETYGEIDRFRVAVRALPIPAVDITPADPLLRTNPPHFGFTLAEEVGGIDGLACFASHEGKVRVERLGPRIEVRMARPIPAGRGRLNCTMPTLEGRWRWFGWQFVAP